MGIAGLRAHPMRDRALAAIRIHGPLTTNEIAERVGWSMSMSQLRGLLDTLERAGLVTVDRPTRCGRGRCNIYRAGGAA